MQEHRPDYDWRLVAGPSERQPHAAVILHAMCICGDDDCGWTLAPYPTDAQSHKGVTLTPYGKPPPLADTGQYGRNQ